MPPGPFGFGYKIWGPLDVRSAVMHKIFPSLPLSNSVAAPAITRAEVAQAWLTMGPVMPSAPIMAATQGAP